MRAGPNKATLAGVLTGLVAGMLTVALLVLVDNRERWMWAAVICPGSIFGLVESAYLWGLWGMRSIPRLFAFTAGSALAHIAAMYAAIVIVSKSPWTFYLFYLASFIAGLLGAFLLLLSALLLLSIGITPLQVFWKSLLWSIAGGALGVAGLKLGEWITSVFGLRGNQDVYVLYLIWQTGAALCLSILFCTEKLRVHTELSM
jgi:hypothetical protein